MLKIAICDDCTEDYEALKNILQQIDTTPIQIHIFTSGEAVLSAIKEEGLLFDVLFLDIYMTGMTGIETAGCIRDHGLDIPIIFTTTTKEFAVESYEVNATDYLIKPVELERVKKSLSKLQSFSPQRYLVVQSEGRVMHLPYQWIQWMESHQHTVTIHMKDGQRYGIRHKLSSLEIELDDPRFLRCHQSYLVNMDYIQWAQQDFCLTDGTRIPITVRQRKKCVDCYQHYFVEKSIAAAEDWLSEK